MLYALLIYEAETASSGYTDEELEKALAGHRALQEEAKAGGVFVEANQLMPPGTASSVSVRGSKVRVFDGPFTETKEQLIGYYLLDLETLEEALEWAARIPHAATGAIEVRPATYFERSECEARVWTSSD